MFNLADFVLQHVPLPSLPSYLINYIPNRTPLSQWSQVSTALVSYLAVVFSLRELMRSRPPMRLTFLFQLHNIILSVGSGFLLILMLEEITPIVWNHGVFYGICNTNAWTPKLEFYYMINYYIKYLELIDTVFLALKKKPLAFLHVFHHSATALLCFTQLNGKTSVSWVPITLNLTVHVVMYYYYYATAGGRRIWWKKYLTSMQITQFVIDLVAVYFASTYLVLPSYSYYVSTYFQDKLPAVGNCSGTEAAATFGCALLTSYLFLFIHFYIQTYKKPTEGRGRGKEKEKLNGTANHNGIVPNGVQLHR